MSDSYRDLIHDLRALAMDASETARRKMEEAADAIERMETAEAFVRHTERCSCNCQQNAVDVQRNAHWDACMVGKAQKYFGKRVTSKR